MERLILGLVVFFGGHSISLLALGWRNRVAERLGPRTWQLVYSIFALSGFYLLVTGYGAARASAAVLYVTPPWLRYVAALLMLPAFTLALASVLPGRIRVLSRHPLLLATLFWAVAHLLTNGSVADLLLFGTFLHLGRRRTRLARASSGPPEDHASEIGGERCDRRSRWTRALRDFHSLAARQVVRSITARLKFHESIQMTTRPMPRLARPEDIEQVYRIYMHERVIPYLGHDPMDLEAFRIVFDGLLAAGGFYVVEREGNVAGFYRIMQFDGRAQHVAQLGTLAVDPKYQGSGLARDMVTGAIEQMKALGVRRAELQAEADNARGLAFYRKLGFEQEGVQRKAYRRAGENTDIDEIMMVRFLD